MRFTHDKKIAAVVLAGPTAVGKTGLSLRLAEKFSAEIISADSMQVYRYMDVGTAKASAAERSRVPHHLIDIVDPDDNYSLARFINDARQALVKIAAGNHVPLIVGGTGLYIKGLLEGVFDMAPADPAIRADLEKCLKDQGRTRLYDELRSCDPESAARIHPNDTHRLLRALEIFRATGIPWSRHLAGQQQTSSRLEVLKLGLICERERLYERINNRVRLMLEQGLLEEVQKLLNMGYDSGLKSMQSIGYRHMINFLENKWTWQEAVNFLARDTRRYAKRQYTWFGRDQDIHWLDPDRSEDFVPLIENFLDAHGKGEGGKES